MASRRKLNENEIENTLLETDDEESIVLGDELEDESDEIIQDFRLEEDSLSTSDDPEVVESESDEEVEASSQLRSTITPVTVLSVPEVMRGKGKNNSEKFVWYGSYPCSSRTPRRNIIFHSPGNKGPAKFITNAFDSWQLFFIDEVLEKIVSYRNQEISVILDYTIWRVL